MSLRSSVKKASKHSNRTLNSSCLVFSNDSPSILNVSQSAFRTSTVLSSTANNFDFSDDEINESCNNATESGPMGPKNLLNVRKLNYRDLERNSE